MDMEETAGLSMKLSIFGVAEKHRIVTRMLLVLIGHDRA